MIAQPFRFSRISHLIFGIVLPLLALLCTPAQAGHWNMVPSYTGPVHIWADNSALTCDAFGSVVSSFGSSGSLTNSSQGSVTIDFYWIPDPNNPLDAPPTSLHLKETCEAGYDAECVNQVDDIAVTNIVVDDGCGDPVK